MPSADAYGEEVIGEFLAAVGGTTPYLACFRQLPTAPPYARRPTAVPLQDRALRHHRGGQGDYRDAGGSSPIHGSDPESHPAAAEGTARPAFSSGPVHRQGCRPSSSSLALDII